MFKHRRQFYYSHQQTFARWRDGSFTRTASRMRDPGCTLIQPTCLQSSFARWRVSAARGISHATQHSFNLSPSPIIVKRGQYCGQPPVLPARQPRTVIRRKICSGILSLNAAPWLSAPA